MPRRLFLGIFKVSWLSREVRKDNLFETSTPTKWPPVMLYEKEMEPFDATMFGTAQKALV